MPNLFRHPTGKVISFQVNYSYGMLKQVQHDSYFIKIVTFIVLLCMHSFLLITKSLNLPTDLMRDT
jgi:hypothetical protein